MTLKIVASCDIRITSMKLISLFCLFLGLLCAPAYGEKQLIDRVIAVVNDEPITQSELDSLLRPVYNEYSKEYRDQRLMIKLNEARQKLLNQLIEDRLVLQDAKTRSIQIDEKEINGQMDQFRKRFPDEAALEEALKQEGLTLTAMRDRLRRQMMVRRLHDIEIRSKVVVSPLELEAYYKNNPAEFSSQEKLKIRSVTIRKNDEAREKGLTDEIAIKRMEAVRGRILSGEDFGTLARDVSEDTNAEREGLTDWIERGEMIPVIDEVIFNMKKWQISEIIETPMGYHLFRLENKKEGHKESFDDVRNKLYSKLFMQKAEKRFREWMKELKRSAYISVR